MTIIPPNAHDLLKPLQEYLTDPEVASFARFFLDRAIATVAWDRCDDWAILVSLSTRTVRWKTPREGENWGRRMARAPIPRWTLPFKLVWGRWVPTNELNVSRRAVHFHLPRTIPDRDFYAAMNIVDPLGEQAWSDGTRTLFGPCRRGPEWGVGARTWVMPDLSMAHDRIADLPTSAA